ncbi:unnamed protein product (macronuclear) [Paramecium tetraurelia]|uniref:Uncharacterized protein n=1 Tax=Paramecium tetraurelia TaxID=5888 RepID=A0EF28_PARTE|nr:uncharacterized protein GSPATT00026242001 [Paramecium tetraurelia]CAK93919.1 unnamed protein product [Paramecium tetraurelia]|eukprot:XP_001461292.1 hypothetical protein (macronuclear) [Paramecium tetraurelia strain d4-2]
MAALSLDLFNTDSYIHNSHMEEENQDEFCFQSHQEYTKQPTTTTKQETVTIKEADIKYKNLPKMIGNNLVKWLKKKYPDQSKIPKGLSKIVEMRENEKQSNIKIKDLRESVISDEDSKVVFQEYISDQLFLDLLSSNKVADPFSYIPGISNYFSAANEPEKMKGNYMMRSLFISQ